MDAILFGCLAAVGFLGLLGLWIGILVFAAVMHAWGLFWPEFTFGIIMLAVMFGGKLRGLWKPPC